MLDIGFWPGLIMGIVIGGLLIDVNIRTPNRLKNWLSAIDVSKRGDD